MKRTLKLALYAVVLSLFLPHRPVLASCDPRLIAQCTGPDCPPDNQDHDDYAGCPAFNNACSGEACPPRKGHHVIYATGEEDFETTDLTVNGSFPITVTRRYNSGSVYDSPLGYGWSLNYNYRLYKFPQSITQGVVVIRADCGARFRFYYVGVDSSGNTQWTPFSGPFHGTLVGNTDGSWTFTLQNGWVYRFDVHGRLIALTDPRGPSLSFSYTPDRMPLTGVSPFGFSSDQLMVVAYDYQLTRIDEKAAGQWTGRWIAFTYDPSTGRLTSLADFTGRTVRYAQDRYGNLSQVTDPMGNVFSYGYADNHGLRGIHRLTSFTPGGCSSCSNASRVDLSYDPYGDVLSESRWGGIQTRFQYPSFTGQRPIVETDVTVGTGTWKYLWNGRERPSQVVDPLGNPITTYYDATLSYPTLEITSEAPQPQSNPPTLRLRKQVQKSWDGEGNLLQEITLVPPPYPGQPSEVITRTMTYDHDKVLSETTVSSLYPSQVFQTVSTYQPSGGGWPTNLQTLSVWDGSEWLNTAYAYDGNGQLSQITRPNGDVEPYVFSNGCLVNANGILYQNDSLCRRTSVQDRNGNTTTFAYDALDRVVSSTDPLGASTLYTYTGTKLTQIEAGITATQGGHLTTYQYDPYDRLVETDGHLGGGVIRLNRVSFDAHGNVSTQTDPDGNVTTFKYDALNRLVTVIDPLLNTMQYGYDALGNRTSAIDPNGNSTFWTYDGLSRLVQVQDAKSGLTRYSYDPRGDLLTLADANGNTTTYGYDLAGRLLSESRPSGRKTLYSYDAKGRMVGRQDPKGQVAQYAYRSVDDALTSIRYFASSSSLLASRTVTFSLDGNGNELSVDDDALYSLTNGKPIYVNAFDALNRMTAQLANHVGKVVAYAYDAFGNRSSMTVRDLASGTVLFSLAYAYDEQDRLVSMTQSPGASTAAASYGFTYFPSGRVQSKTFPNRVAGSYAYLKDGTIASISYADTRGNQLLGLAYGEDKDRNLTSQVRTEPGGVQITRNFSYDPLNQLVQVDRNPGTGNVVGFERFSYDPVGNRLTAGGPGSLNGSYSYDADNRLNSVSAGSTVTSFTWDENGNQLSQVDGEGTRGYGYEYENRLATFSFTDPLGNLVTTAAYLYDPIARRLSKAVNGQEMRFLWDQDVMIGELTSQGTLTRIYVMNPQANEPCGIIDAPTFGSGATTNAYLTDHLYTPLVTVDAIGASPWRAELSSFGTPLSLSGILNQPIRFAGQVDYASGQPVYNANRWYLTFIGAYGQIDPVRRLASDHYRYARSNPVIRIDPLGLLSLEEVQTLVKANNLSGQSDSLIICIAWKESSFDPDATNPDSTAKGLMQVTDLALSDYKMRSYRGANMFDQAQNIRAGSFYLSIVLNRTHGDLARALDRYGQGPDSGYHSDIMQCDSCMKESGCASKSCLGRIRPYNQ